MVGTAGGESSILNGLMVILGESKMICGESYDLAEERDKDGDGPGLNTSSSSSDIARHKYLSRSVLSNLKTCSALPWNPVVPGMGKGGGGGCGIVVEETATVGGCGPPKIPPGKLGLLPPTNEEDDDEDEQLGVPSPTKVVP